MADILTHEDFANICLRIKNGDVKTEIPCCANCKYYIEFLDGNMNFGYKCFHPRLQTVGSYAYITMQPEDFCSRYTERSK